MVGRSGGLGPNAQANNDAAIPRAATGGPAQGSAPPGGGPGAAETGNAPRDVGEATGSRAPPPADREPDLPAQGPQSGPEAGLEALNDRQPTTEADSLRRPSQRVPAEKRRPTSDPAMRRGLPRRNHRTAGSSSHMQRPRGPRRRPSASAQGPSRSSPGTTRATRTERGMQTECSSGSKHATPLGKRTTASN